MFLTYFTEQPMSAYDEQAGLDAGYTAVLFSNEHYDAHAASRLFEERKIEYILAEQAGFDGIMVNEHHNAPFCMQPQISVWSSILAAITERVKIVQLGNPLPIYDNPLQFAESIAMIDCISKGRLVSGIVRGGGSEHFCMNANPAYNRERFYEAHDLLVEALSRPGPFSWEGEHYQLRVVNPWARPLQQPLPPIWVPGVFSPETIVFAAEHRYPYIALNTPWHLTGQLWQIYDDAAERAGYTAGPEHRGYLLRVHVQDTEEKAIENARQFMWMLGEFTGVGHPYWVAPPGYSSAMRDEWLPRANGLAPKSASLPFEAQLEELELIAGTPEQVVAGLRTLMERLRPGILVLWANDGKISHEDSKRCIELLGQEVLPAVRQIADELGLPGPFEAGLPVRLPDEPPRELRLDMPHV
jgi:alkanesulfonate monooxygenase SsuD/methylene tetrahydromethanopterin reductase-like flavin-dependent oxidoreductase (luciferase family)